ncbi:MAG: energy transducer TonB [Erythrobacter sp.]
MEIRPLRAAVLAAALALPAHAQEMDGAPEPMADAWPSEPVPIGNEALWVTNADYPLDAWRDGEAGDIFYELKVNRAGKVTGCTADEGTASARLKAETCRLLRERAQFEPARDEQGRAVASVYSGVVSWKREPELGNGSFTIRIAFTLDERGEVHNCRILERSGAIPAGIQRSFEKEPCPADRSRIPARDPEGRPVARDVVLTVSVESTPAAAGGAPSGN